MPQDGNTVGRLIDLDHAKVVRSSRTIERCTGNSPGAEKLVKMCRLYLPSIHDEVIKTFIEHFAVNKAFAAAHYISEIVDFREKNFGLDAARGVKLDDLGWHYQVGWKSV